MLRLLIDHDLDQDILRGLMQRVPDLDVVTARDAGLSEAPDPELLAWAAQEGRVTITHDQKTMPNHAAWLMAAGQSIAGVIVVSRRLTMRRVISDLEIIVMCSEPAEWENVIKRLPL